MERSFEIISPVHGEIFAELHYASSKTINVTISNAYKAYQTWKKTTIQERAEKCLKVVQFFKDHADQFALELTMMMGRPIRYSPLEITGGFVERASYMIAVAERALSNKEIDEKSGYHRYIKREPLGPVLVLAPWNYPYLTSVNAIIPAIMAGNTVILKHANQTACCAQRYQEAFDAAEFPDGVFQHLQMDHDQAAKVIKDPSIAYTAFTGSVEGGRAVQKASADRFTPLGLELGGKDPAYVCDDADLDQAVKDLVDGSFFNSGQSCCGVERIYVQKKVFAEFVDEFTSLTRKYVVGDPTQSETTLGPMVRKENAMKVLKQIDQAVALGARKHIDSSDFETMEIPYLAPQVLTDVNHQMDIMRSETFGPVVGIMEVRNELEAVELMNDSSFGLTASIWTKDIEKAMAIGEQVDTGTWFMNRCDYLDPELAWTGIKNSGRGCSLSSLGYDYLTRPKSFHLKKQQ